MEPTKCINYSGAPYIITDISIAVITKDMYEGDKLKARTIVKFNGPISVSVTALSTQRYMYVVNMIMMMWLHHDHDQV